MAKLRGSPLVSIDEKSNPDPSINADTTALFEEAVKANSRRLLAIARAIVGTRASPEDVVQQAVMNLFQHRHRYDWREPRSEERRVGKECRAQRGTEHETRQEDNQNARDA